MPQIDPDKPAANPFWFSECFVMPMPLGKKAANLRELFEILQAADDSVLHYHLLQFRLSASQPVLHYPNEFAQWAATSLQDPLLAEKLSSFDPFDYDNMGQVKQAILEILEEYLWNLPYIPWVRPGREFHFCESSMVVIPQEMRAATLREFCQILRTVGLDSVYYHFFEARHRLEARQLDDFSYWLDTNFALPELVAAIRDLDIYFFTLGEIREILLGLILRHLGEWCEKL